MCWEDGIINVSETFICYGESTVKMSVKTFDNFVFDVRLKWQVE